MNLKNLQLNGMELVDPNANYSGDQVIYLDFKGANNVAYNNDALNIHVNGIDVADSGLDRTSINQLITELNTTYANTGIYFTTELTENTEHSTIYVGSTGSAFAQYGNFLGVSETIDAGDKIKNDNAFVFSDKIASTDQLAATIAHETGHLIGFEHENTQTGTLNDYAATYHAAVMSYEPFGSDALAIYANFEGKIEFIATISDTLNSLKNGLLSSYSIDWNIQVKVSNPYWLDSVLVDTTYKTNITYSGGQFVITKQYSELSSVTEKTSSATTAENIIRNIGIPVGADNNKDGYPDGGVAYVRLNATTDITNAYVTCNGAMALFDRNGTNYFNIKGSNTSDDYGNQVGNAKAMSGTSVNGTINYDQDVDVFSKYFYSGMEYRITLTGTGGTLFRLTGGDEGLTEQNVKMQTGGNDYLWTCKESGTYYMAVWGINGGTTYTLSEAKNASSISINDLSSVDEGRSVTYKCTATYSDNSTETITPKWTVNSTAATIDSSGSLTAKSVDADENIIVTATFQGKRADDTITVKDTTPKAPSNLSATTDSSTQISLVWTDNSNNETCFKIERKQGANGSWSCIDLTLADDNTYTDVNLASNTTYYYRVYSKNTSAADGYGNSTYSNESSASTSPPPPPATPVLEVSANSLDFGSSDTSGSFKIGNCGTGTLNYSISTSGASWLQITNPDGVATTYNEDAVTVTIDRSKLSAGSNSTTITVVNKNDSNDKKTISISATGTTSPAPNLEVSVNSLDFGSYETNLSFKIGNASTGTLNYSISTSGASWLQITNNPDGSATTKDEDAVTVTIDRSKLSAGSNPATITVVNKNDSSDKETITISATGVVAPPPGGDNGYLVLDGKDDYVDCGSGGILAQDPKVITQSVWIKTTSDAFSTLLTKRHANDGSDWSTIYIDNGIAFIAADDKDDMQKATGKTKVNDGSWHNLVGVRNGAQYSIYVDGALEDSITYSLKSEGGSMAPFQIGHDGAWKQYFNGGIDEVAVWQDALGTGEIAAIYNLGRTGDLSANSGNYTSSSDLDGYWRFNEGSGTIAYDSSSNGNNGTINGGATREGVVIPTITIAVQDATAGEPADSGTFRISRTGDTTSALTVNFSTGGTATSGSDYTLKNGSAALTSSVIIAAGQSYADVTLGVIDDTIVEGTETAVMNLTANAAYTLGATTSATINITDDDKGGKTFNAANGHYYQAVYAAGSITWDAAKAAAEAAGGHLATIADVSENQFVTNLYTQDSRIIKAWLGGYQPQGSAEPAGGWKWVTGETWNDNSYKNLWNANEPNNANGNECYLEYNDNTGKWNDAGNQDLPTGYVIEWENALPVVTIALQDATAGEPSDNGTFRISRTGDTTNALTVNFSTGGTATGGSDYTLKNGSTSLTSSVIIAAGQSYADVTLGVMDDTIVEGTETAVMNLTANAAYTLGATTSATINITDNDVVALPAVTIAATDATAGEPSDNGTFRISRTGDTTNALTVNFSTGGTATSGSDYTLKNGSAALTSSVIIAAGQSYADVTLGVIDDTIVEGTETAVMNLTANAVYTLGATTSATINITDNDTDVGNTLATAGTLDVNGSVDEWVGLGDPADYYKLTLDNAGTLNLNLTNLSDNANLTLYDAKGKLLKSSSAKGSADENINNLALLGGDYYVKVAPSDGGKGTVNTGYTLSNTVDYFPDDTVGNTLATAGTLDVNGSVDEWVGFGDSADYYKLTLDTAGTLNLNLTDLSGDANLTLYDAKGKLLKASNNKGSADENITNLALLGGDYYVKVAPSDGGKGTVNTGYTLSNTVDYFPDDTVGNTLATAGTLDVNGSADEWVGFGDPADYYKLTLETAGTLNLNLTGLSGDANLTLYDAKGKLLKSSSNKGVADENITNLALLGGDYYVKVAPADGGKGTVNNTGYTLSNTVDYFPDDTAGNTFAAALQVSESGPVSEWLGFGDKDDYYKFELQTGTTVTLNLTDMTSNVNLYLYDSKSKQLAVSAKAGNAADSITKTLAAGTYYVKATLAGKDNTNYNLDFNIDPAAFKSGSLRLFGPPGVPINNGFDAALTGSNDPLKKNQGVLAS